MMSHDGTQCAWHALIGRERGRPWWHMAKTMVVLRCTLRDVHFGSWRQDVSEPRLLTIKESMQEGGGW